MTHHEYPKALTKTVDGRIHNLVYPAGHPKQYTMIVFDNADEEAAYDDCGVVAEVRLAPTGEHVAEVITAGDNHHHQHPQAPVGHRGEVKVPHVS